MLADALIAGSEEGPKGGRGGYGPRLIEADFAAQLHRLPVGQASAAHLAASPVEDDLGAFVVAVGASLPEVGDGNHHQAGVGRLEGGIVEAPTTP